MTTFTAMLRRMGQNGEKTGWTYVYVPNAITDLLNPGQKVSFRVKGSLDDFPIKLVALIPMGDHGGDEDASFIIPVNAAMRRGIGKEAGASVRTTLALDTDPLPQSDDLLLCLEDEPDALATFNRLPPSHRNYYFKWIESAKTPETKAKRIARTLTAMTLNLSYGEMMRANKTAAD
ncbi:DUF1905 domain-containing protein [Fibrella sp. HMF5335]|uniref:DUF1905 domain-containing protein n=1 Tax=Fibrella rubiginis TaxID=2817060 RepID=A0A939GMX1_9BACT|nr:YdeI/OmpD-associated family protein [Fibrella rubiginis]MBO0939750.1 DUF1905 domain-containing protein [Fibrella rubiginis]